MQELLKSNNLKDLSFHHHFTTLAAGVICAAPVMEGWYRAQVVEVSHETDEVDVRFLDYGGLCQDRGVCP